MFWDTFCSLVIIFYLNWVVIWGCRDFGVFREEKKWRVIVISRPENNSSLLKVSWPQNNKQERRAVKGVCANNKDEFKMKWDYNLLQLCLKSQCRSWIKILYQTFRKTDEMIRILKSVAIQLALRRRSKIQIQIWLNCFFFISWFSFVLQHVFTIFG